MSPPYIHALSVRAACLQISHTFMSHTRPLALRGHPATPWDTDAPDRHPPAGAQHMTHRAAKVDMPGTPTSHTASQHTVTPLRPLGTVTHRSTTTAGAGRKLAGPEGPSETHCGGDDELTHVRHMQGDTMTAPQTPTHRYPLCGTALHIPHSGGILHPVVQRRSEVGWK